MVLKKRLFCLRTLLCGCSFYRFTIVVAATLLAVLHTCEIMTKVMMEVRQLKKYIRLTLLMIQWFVILSLLVIVKDVYIQQSTIADKLQFCPALKGTDSSKLHYHTK